MSPATTGTRLLCALVIADVVCQCTSWRTVSIVDFGAVGDNKTDDTMAVRSALLAVEGGGEVVVPEGVFQTAPFNS